MSGMRQRDRHIEVTEGFMRAQRFFAIAHEVFQPHRASDLIGLM